MAATLNKALPDLSKLEPLDGTNYKRWSQKLLIFCEQLEVDYVLFSEPPSSAKSAADTSKEEEAKKKYEKDNKMVRGHLLNNMNNALFDLLVNYKSAKEIWDLLEKKYGGDDAGKKKYVVGKWLHFRMVDDKPIMEQVHEYENLTADVLNEGMKMCEILQANVLLEKFPPSWSDYRNHLKHKKKDLSLQELVSHMRTEEANRLKDKLDVVSSTISKANLVETGDFSVKDRSNKGQKKGPNQGDHKKPIGVNKADRKIEKKTINRNCYVCGDSSELSGRNEILGSSEILVNNTIINSEILDNNNSIIKDHKVVLLISLEGK